MLSRLDIANLALGKLGVSLTISDFNNDISNQAKIVRRHYKVALDELLEKHEWNFATKYAALTLVSEDAESPYRYLYSVPSDLLILREIAAKDQFTDLERYEDYKVRWEEQYEASGAIRVRTNQPDAWGKYTVAIVETFNFPSHFGRALAAQLALEIAPSLITNNFPKVKATLASDVENEVSKGIAYDLGRRPRKLESLSPFVLARQ